MNIQKMMQQAQKMQKDMVAKTEELEAKTYSAKKDGMVSVVVNGKLAIESIEIDPELLNADYKEELESVVLLVVNEAIKKANDDKEETLGKLTGGMNIPGLF
jgi:DNA-binding YbaB/EbfC family protein